MKRLTKEDFISRVNEVAKANKIFIPSITNNVNEAFAIYQQVLADDDKQMSVVISKENKAGQHINPLLRGSGNIECPECGAPHMLLRSRISDMDGVIWNSGWECQDCFSVYYSEKTTSEWMNELESSERLKK